MRSDCLGGVGVGAPFRKTEDVGRAETKIITERLSSEGPGSEGLFSQLYSPSNQIEGAPVVPPSLPSSVTREQPCGLKKKKKNRCKKSALTPD